MKKRTRIILSVCLAVLLVFEIGGYAYVSDYYHADEIALEAMAYQTDSVQTEQDGNVIWFVPENPTTGLIFYPGGKVEYTAYAPLLRPCCAPAQKTEFSALWCRCPAIWRCWTPMLRTDSKKNTRRSRPGT